MWAPYFLERELTMLGEMLDRHFFPHYDILKEFGIDRKIIVENPKMKLCDFRHGYTWAIFNNRLYVARGVSSVGSLFSYTYHEPINDDVYQVDGLCGVITYESRVYRLMILGSENRVEIDENICIIKKEVT